MPSQHDAATLVTYLTKVAWGEVKSQGLGRDLPLLPFEPMIYANVTYATGTPGVLGEHFKAPLCASTFGRHQIVGSGREQGEDLAGDDRSLFQETEPMGR